VAYDAGGDRVDLAQALPQLINLTKDRASQARSDAAVVFNCVGNWPIEPVARSKQDFVYIEVWPPHTGYSDLHGLIVEAQAQSGGKPVVLAAYIDPARARNARLADAVILASGGSHIELGEPGMMLADPYFPACEPMDKALARVMRRTYDFAVRYENILALDTHDATPETQGRLHIEGTRTSPGQTGGHVWPIVRRQAGTIAISLINLLGVDALQWDRPLEVDPVPQRDLLLRLQTPGPVRQIWWATADGDDPAGHALAFRQEREGGHTSVTMTVPWLAYWDLVVVETEAPVETGA
jgi:dextranase